MHGAMREARCARPEALPALLTAAVTTFEQIGSQPMRVRCVSQCLPIVADSSQYQYQYRASVVLQLSRCIHCNAFPFLLTAAETTFISCLNGPNTHRNASPLFPTATETISLLPVNSAGACSTSLMLRNSGAAQNNASPLFPTAADSSYQQKKISVPRELL